MTTKATSRIELFDANDPDGAIFVGISKTRQGEYNIYAERIKLVRTTFSIEIKMDIGPDAQMDAMKAVVTEAARMVYAQAIMLASSRKPQLIVQAENSMIGIEALNINDNLGE